jgi:LacI family transcriptional regulator
VTDGPANIYAVADRAGVSIATVSRVQNANGPVSPETRERVLRAIEEMGYTPNGSGRALAVRRHDAVGIVFPDLSGPYYSELILGCERATVEAGQSLFILGTHGRKNSDELVLDLMGRVDGLIVTGRTVDDDVVARLANGRVPVVLLGRPSVEGVPSVCAESLRPAIELTNHVFAHGHRRLAFIGDPACSPDAEERWRGFALAHADAGVPGPAAPVAAAFGEAAGREAAEAALDSGATALVCADDELALGACVAARARGLRIPEDIAITGWDDIQLARFVSPSLTTVRQPMRTLGATAAQLLLELIADRAPASVVLRSDVVIRASCGCEPSSDISEPEVALR